MTTLAVLAAVVVGLVTLWLCGGRERSDAWLDRLIDRMVDEALALEEEQPDADERPVADRLADRRRSFDRDIARARRLEVFRREDWDQ